MLATMGVMRKGARDRDVNELMGIPSIETGVFGGIMVGVIAASAVQPLLQLQLAALSGLLRRQALRADRHGVCRHRCGGDPAASSGRRSAAGSRPSRTGRRTDNPALAFTIYGVVERSLIPFGLHHVWNVPFFFQAGRIRRPDHRPDGATAKSTLHRGRSDRRQHDRRLSVQDVGPAGSGVAIWPRARPENRAKVGGIMISAALTSFLTGITEPIEFAFLFVAPLLYAIHALLAGVAYIRLYRCSASSTASPFRTA